MIKDNAGNGEEHVKEVHKVEAHLDVAHRGGGLLGVDRQKIK